MSGGAFNYGHEKVNLLAEDLEGYLGSSLGKDEPQEIVDFFLTAIGLLRLGSKLSFHLDNYVSCDVGEVRSLERLYAALRDDHAAETFEWLKSYLE